MPAVQPVPQVQAPASPQPVAPIRQHSSLSLNDGTVLINGERKEWKDLTGQGRRIKDAVRVPPFGLAVLRQGKGRR